MRSGQVSPEELATRLQANFPRWMIIWSAYRQAFTAFAACTAEPLIIDEPTVDRLLGRIGEVELAVSVGRPVLS